MALKVDYFVRETTTNLRRNVTITVASILTIAVSLTLVGSGWMLRSAIQHSTKRWQGDVEFIVFMKPVCSKELPPDTPCASQDQIDAIGRQLQALQTNNIVRSYRYFDQNQAYAEAKDLFRQEPTLIQALNNQTTPSSWRVAPVTHNADSISQIGQQFHDRPGVLTVQFAYDDVRTVNRLAQLVSVVIFVTAIVLLVAAVMLILNTIRMAVFARRREIEVMKLVGATNWFIRVPFMLEGLVQGVIGALPAIAAVWGLRVAFQNAATNNASTHNLLAGLYVSQSEAVLVSIVLLVAGCAIGMIGSGWAVSRFLRV